MLPHAKSRPNYHRKDAPPLLELQKLSFFLNRKKADVSYLLMEMTKITDRVDILESESNDGSEETKSAGTVNIEFTGDHLFSGLSDLVQSRRYGSSYGNVPPSNDDPISLKITKEGFQNNYLKVIKKLKIPLC